MKRSAFWTVLCPPGEAEVVSLPFCSGCLGLAPPLCRGAEAGIVKLPPGALCTPPKPRPPDPIDSTAAPPSAPAPERRMLSSCCGENSCPAGALFCCAAVAGIVKLSPFCGRDCAEPGATFRCPRFPASCASVPGPPVLRSAPRRGPVGGPFRLLKRGRFPRRSPWSPRSPSPWPGIPILCRRSAETRPWGPSRSSSPCAGTLCRSARGFSFLMLLLWFPSLGGSPPASPSSRIG